MPIEKIPVVLVTGFLGSGKTTFLQQLANNHPRRKLLFLVNEFAQAGVDGQTLRLTEKPTHSVVGGSLFCECKAAEFVRIMHGKIRDLHQAGELEQVVIETSGIADPAAIGRLMADHKLDAFFEVQRIVTIIAPPRFSQLFANLSNVRAQVQSSDLVIINKTDLSTPEQLDSARSLVHEINPRADVLESSHCRVRFQFTRQNGVLPNGPLATCDANPFSTRTVSLGQRVNSSALRHWVDSLPASILRVKGRVSTDTGCWQIQHTPDQTTITPTPSATPSQLILIAHDDDESVLGQFSDKLRTL